MSDVPNDMSDVTNDQDRQDAASEAAQNVVDEVKPWPTGRRRRPRLHLAFGHGRRRTAAHRNLRAEHGRAS